MNSPDRSQTSTLMGCFCARFGIKQTSRAGELGRQPTRLPERAMLDLTTMIDLLVVVLLANPPRSQSTASIEGLFNDRCAAILPSVEIAGVSRQIGLRHVGSPPTTAAIGFHTQLLRGLKIRVRKRK
jgi:hypothetical protein